RGRLLLGIQKRIELATGSGPPARGSDRECDQHGEIRLAVHLLLLSNEGRDLFPLGLASPRTVTESPARFPTAASRWGTGRLGWRCGTPRSPVRLGPHKPPRSPPPPRRTRRSTPGTR